MIGTILSGRYEILEEIGKGGMAHVYKAHCRLLNRTVAVKVLRNDLEGGEEFTERFNIEAQSAAGLTHPNIVSIYDVGEDNGRHYIVMEYIEGVTLKEYIKEHGRLSNFEAASIASQICGALEAAHTKNIVHRDIKPHNIMITSDNLVKVTDFGIARASSGSTLQAGDSILGSVHYISPEQARGGYVDCKSDIYSLGIVLYEMLTGSVPFESDSPIAVAMKHLEEKPKNPCELNPDVPEELQEIVLKAMSKETRNRYQTVGAMKSDLEAIMPRLKENEDTEVSDDTRKFTPINSETAEIREQETEEETEDEDNNLYQVSEAEDDEDEEEPRGSVGNMIFAAVLTAFLIVGGISVGVTYLLYPELPIFNLFSNSDITVPQYVGMDYDAAEKKAAKDGLILEIGDRIESSEKINTVVKQNTAKGRKVKKGETIIVYVSSGPGDVDFEEYIGMKASKAVSKLEAKGYTVTQKKKSDTEIAKDCIISIKQSGSKLTVYVSKGYDDIEVVVPYLVGKKLDAAEKMLDDSKLSVGEIKYVESDIYNAGTVINQGIASGETVNAKTAIDLTVAGTTKDNSKKDDEGEEENVQHTQPSNKAGSRTLSIGLPTDRSTVQVKVVSKSADSNGSEKTEFNSTVNTSEAELVLKVSGSGKVEYTIYFDGSQVSTKTVDFSK